MKVRHIGIDVRNERAIVRNVGIASATALETTRSADRPRNGMGLDWNGKERNGDGKSGNGNDSLKSQRGGGLTTQQAGGRARGRAQSILRGAALRNRRRTGTECAEDTDSGRKDAV